MRLPQSSSHTRWRRRQPAWRQRQPAWRQRQAGWRQRQSAWRRRCSRLPRRRACRLTTCGCGASTRREHGASLRLFRRDLRRLCVELYSLGAFMRCVKSWKQQTRGMLDCFLGRLSLTHLLCGKLHRPDRVYGSYVVCARVCVRPNMVFAALSPEELRRENATVRCRTFCLRAIL